MSYSRSLPVGGLAVTDLPRSPAQTTLPGRDHNSAVANLERPHRRCCDEPTPNAGTVACLDDAASQYVYGGSAFETIERGRTATAAAAPHRNDAASIRVRETDHRGSDARHLALGR